MPLDASKDYYIGRDQTFFEQIVGSASQMIMTIIVSQVLAAWKYGLQGLNALETAEKAAKFTQAGQMAILGATSGKSGASEAYAEGATEGQALLYGLARGMLEVMTENIANGIPGFETVDEGELIRKISNLLSKNPKVASYIEKGLNIVGEGNEEVINALVTPWIKRAIYNSSAPGTMIDELAKAFVGGAIMSVMISGGYGAIEYAENTIEKVRAATIAGDPAASTDTKFQAAIQVAQQEAAPADVSGAEVVTRVNDALGQKLGKEAVEAAARVYESDTFRAAVKQAIEQTAQLQMTEEEIAAGIELVQTMDIDSIPRDFSSESVNKVLAFGEILNGLAEKTVDAMLESDTTKTRDPANYKYEPYTEGPVPQTTNAEAAETVVLPPAETVAIAVQIQNAKAEAHRDGKSEKGTLKDVAKQVFSSKYGDSLTAVVKSTNIEGKPYKVIAYKGVSGEIVNNRIATLQDVIAVSKIKEIIENGNYVGSKKSELKGTRNSEAIRYDYFTTQIKIGSKIYSANWDVKVFPESNQYYIHRINSITLKENSGSDAYVEGAKYVPAAARNPNSGTIISNPAENVKTFQSTDYGKSIYPIPADFKASNYLLLTKNMLL